MHQMDPTKLDCSKLPRTHTCTPNLLNLDLANSNTLSATLKRLFGLPPTIILCNTHLYIGQVHNTLCYWLYLCCFHLPYSIIYTDEHAPGPCTVDITALFKEFTTTSVVEATPDFLEIPHVSTDDTKLNCQEGDKVCERQKKHNFLIELYPLQLKTFIITLQ